MDWNGNRPSIGPIGLVSLSDRLVQLSHVDRRLIRLQNAIPANGSIELTELSLKARYLKARMIIMFLTIDATYCFLALVTGSSPLDSRMPHGYMGSGIISYEYDKREKFKDYNMRADAELGTRSAILRLDG
ncbi:hypothetical protein PIB30_084330 [Stylosanthes scabra]|uniref:Uncharacterized protein n=1 Tax=Stylosanthes scabra TaxID=79078 RepID=A0ABU6URC4_9FABA|nr:hypothetical protein [Stylosanthes scabra]